MERVCKKFIEQMHLRRSFLLPMLQKKELTVLLKSDTKQLFLELEDGVFTIPSSPPVKLDITISSKDAIIERLMSGLTTLKEEEHKHSLEFTASYRNKLLLENILYFVAK